MDNIQKGKILKANDLLLLKKNHTISKAIADKFVLFSLAANTDISEEVYMESKSYYVFSGSVEIQDKKLSSGDFICLDKNELIGLRCDEEGAYLLECIWTEDTKINVDKATILHLKDQIDYVDNGISNVDLAKAKGLKFGLLAFDKGQGLTPHSAPGDAMLIALDGSAKITMGDISAEIHAGEQFIFEKNIPHSVRALEKFKMAILMVV